MKIIQAALGRGRISGAAAALGIAALVILVSQAASARAVTPSAALTNTGSASGPRPSIVLVHGAWADSSSWDAVVTRLQRDRYTVYVPPNRCSVSATTPRSCVTSCTPCPAPPPWSGTPT